MVDSLTQKGKKKSTVNPLKKGYNCEGSNWKKREGEGGIHKTQEKAPIDDIKVYTGRTGGERRRRATSQGEKAPLYSLTSSG